MAFTSLDLVAIDEAIATGAKRVRFQTHEVEYQSLSDQLRARALIKAELEPPPAATGITFTEYDSGY